MCRWSHTPADLDPLQLDAIVYCPREASLAAALSVLQRSLSAQVTAMAEALLTAAPSADVATQHSAKAFAFRLLPFAPHVHTMIYVLPNGCDAVEAPTRTLREKTHRMLGLPLDRPLLRTCNALPHGRAGWGGSGGRLVGSTPIPGLLRDVHMGLAPPGVKNGTTALVQGTYEYFHYMQWTGCGVEKKYMDKYDDCGWGCAYRSLQSILSWFRLQGYTSLPNPTHYEIQKTLVDHCGQDAGQLLGKKMWLGSQDLSYYFDHQLGVTCRTKVANSGDDVPARPRADPPLSDPGHAGHDRRRRARLHAAWRLVRSELGRHSLPDHGPSLHWGRRPVADPAQVGRLEERRHPHAPRHQTI